ncbi:MAG: methylated-DNA--[protein]-cysteine S-methyltransferase [Pirellulaceae bacterium]|nr:methylated-DNA--[protein]-cysteine S-methyltransferase [Pirellulaceae bacterium]
MKITKKELHYTRIQTKIGWISVLHCGKTIQKLVLPESKETLPELFSQEIVLILGPDRVFQKSLEKWFHRYFWGDGKAFDRAEIDLSAFTPFQQKTLQECQKIPFGTTVSYKELAIRVGSPNASRAIGNAMASNPIPLIIPCHRVIQTSGHLGGYSAPGGLSLKKELLDHEFSKNKRKNKEVSTLQKPLAGIR